MVVVDASKMELVAHPNGRFDRCDFSMQNSDSQIKTGDCTDVGLDNFDILVFG